MRRIFPKSHFNQTSIIFFEIKCFISMAYKYQFLDAKKGCKRFEVRPENELLVFIRFSIRPNRLDFFLHFIERCVWLGL